MPATFALAVVIFALGVDSYIVAAVLPAMADDLTESIAAVGLLASAYALPTAVLAPLLGPISDRYGRKFSLFLGLAIFAAACAACIVAPTLPLLLLARAINGVGAAIAMPAAFAAAGDLAAPGQRARAMGVLSGMFPLSTLVGLPIGALAASVAGWRGSFAFITLVAVVAIVLVARLPAVPRVATGPAGSHLATLREAIRTPRAAGSLLVPFLWLAGSFGLFVFLAEFVHRSFGVPTAQAGLIYVVVGLVGVVASRGSGRVVERIGARRTVLVAIGGFVVAALLLPVTAAALPLTVAVFGAWAFCTWTGVPAMQFIVSSLSVNVRGTLLSFLTSANNLGIVVGPILTGRVLEAGGFAWAAPWAAFLGLLALLAAWRLLPDVTEAAPTDLTPIEPLEAVAIAIED
jgi:predicted MFS family arabinose efflux permease